MLMVFSSIAWRPHVETGVEVALRARENGEDVCYVDLTKFLRGDESYYPIHKLIDVPFIRSNNALRILRSQCVRSLVEGVDPSLEKRAGMIAKDILKTIKTHEQFLSIGYEGFHDLGWAALSSAVSYKKDSTIRYETDSRYITGWVEIAIRAYLKAKDIMSRESPSEVVAYNGRFATTRAVIRAADYMGLRWKVYEVGASVRKYRFHDYLPHDRDRVQEDVKKYSGRGADVWGEEFFLARRGLSRSKENVFIKKQEKGVLPEDLSSDYKWVVYFSSSDDEMVAIGGDAQHPVFYDQEFALKCLKKAISEIDGLRLCVRVHPHVSKKSKNDRRKWASLAEQWPDVLFVGPNEEVDTYALLEEAHVVASFGSTVGVEATYWGKPSLLLGRSFYDRLGVCGQPQSLSEMVGFLLNPEVFDRKVPFFTVLT